MHYLANGHRAKEKKKKAGKGEGELWIRWYEKDSLRRCC